MCVYDLTNERSFEHLENYWLKEIRNNAPQNAVLLLVGNKADMESERKVEFDRAEKYDICTVVEMIKTVLDLLNELAYRSTK